MKNKSNKIVLCLLILYIIILYIFANWYNPPDPHRYEGWEYYDLIFK